MLGIWARSSKSHTTWTGEAHIHPAIFFGPTQLWFQAPVEYYTNSPRPLAFLEFGPGTQLIPTAAEFADGSIELLYEHLVTELTTEGGGPARKFPDDAKLDRDKLRQQRREYWSTFAKYFDSRRAMIVIEQASGRHGRIRWIDFRLPLDSEGNTLHLHVCPAANYDSGVFGYNFVRRTFKHGVRIVGTLKSEPDMNVMAIYEM